MRQFGKFWVLILIVILVCPFLAEAQSFTDRFAKGKASFGGNLGYLGHSWVSKGLREASGFVFGAIFDGFGIYF